MFAHYQTGSSEGSLTQLEKRIQADFSLPIQREQSVTFTVDYCALLKLHERTHYFLFKPNQIRIPGFVNGPRNIVHGLSFLHDREYMFGRVKVPEIYVGHIQDWPDKNGAISGSGWSNKKSLINDLNGIYAQKYQRLLTPKDVIVSWRVMLQ